MLDNLDDCIGGSSSSQHSNQKEEERKADFEMP
jgi:hypothetical protein